MCKVGEINLSYGCSTSPKVRQALVGFFFFLVKGSVISPYRIQRTVLRVSSHTARLGGWGFSTVY